MILKDTLNNLKQLKIKPVKISKLKYAYKSKIYDLLLEVENPKNLFHNSDYYRVCVSNKFFRR